ncbi:MAG: hypothetical protein N2490_06050 [Ignavibacteria bacterium]|nr:hypothetical protein [Ignavibacteria bacterium]
MDGLYEVIGFFAGLIEKGGLLFLLFSVIFSFILIRSNLKQIKSLLSNRYFLEIIPQFFPTLGILCTFAGVAYGLRNFDLKDIDNSIPQLIDGLKTAFYASLIGILGLIFYNFYVAKILKKLDEEELSTTQDKELNKLKEITDGLLTSIVSLNQDMQTFKRDIINAIRGENENSLSMEFVKTRNVLQEIKDSLGSSGETSLLTQIQKLRDENNQLRDYYKDILKILNDINDKNFNTINLLNERVNKIETFIKDINETISKSHQVTIQKFDEFNKQLAENNTKALVESMEKVITDFNTQMTQLISRLVQENFDELNNSVKNLNAWQIENKKQIEALINQFNMVSGEIEKSSQNIQKITESTKELVDENSVLSKILQELRKVMVDDKKFTEISSQLEVATKNVAASTSKFNEYLSKSEILTQATKELIIKLNQIERLKDMNSEFWKDIEKKLVQGIALIEEANKKLATDVGKLDRSFNERIENLFKNFDSLMKTVAQKYLVLEKNR